MRYFICRYRSVIGLLMLTAYIVVPFLDSMICADCRGGVPFSGVAEISHLAAPHFDVMPSVGNEADPINGSSGEEANSVCSICVNIAAGTCSKYSAPLDSVGPQNIQITYSIPLEPSFSISKPPQNSPVA